ncbi:hypothetical protein [Streptomyces sp. NPDC006267]|uniref:hypothetical protein n=1 Tax=Streptomyces sp. NPDC006267 TaxID=3157173 RepID=UPI00339E7FDD
MRLNRSQGVPDGRDNRLPTSVGWGRGGTSLSAFYFRFLAHACARNRNLAARSPRQAARSLEWLGNAAETDGRITEARTAYSQALTHCPAENGADADRVRDRLTSLS